ncbi:putative NADPH-dependent methylglyoxal reductase Grp2p [[Candida] jaroonii]|uniref:NADPH-dependent methylglyoxal reductase Grp2p n=1 Tax=[Candida] jaroonii TaxID=467808 RepID=A0ACA9YEB1_9ASCO|nr:putative NADPH-dependent methylglyoxal reductase Grp2p [[Candida] jaroonii]
MSTVFVSGANGYIAQHLIVQLLSKGYSVIGSTRSEDKGENLKKNLNSNDFKYVVIPDIIREDAFDEVLRSNPQITGFFHAASPVVFDVKNLEEDIILPAIKGTTNVLNSIQKFAPQITRFVYTSSYVAIGSHLDTKDTVLTEETWNQIPREGAEDSDLAYAISKTYAEKAVWEFVEKNSPNFTFNTVNPTYVLGPQAFDSEVKGTLNFSAEIINKILKLKPEDEVPEFRGVFIDVRDTARAHLFALETNQSSLRLLCNENYFTNQMCLDIINKNFSLDLPKGSPGTGNDFSQRPTIDNSKTRSLIGPFIGLEESVVDTVKQVVDN